MFFVSNKKYKRLLDKNKELKEIIKEKNEEIDKLNDTMTDISSNLNGQIDQKNKTIETLTDQVEKLQRENDNLYYYYDLNKEPSQEVKTAVRIDKRVHDLELENIELRLNCKNSMELANNCMNSLKSYYSSINPYGISLIPFNRNLISCQTTML